MVNTKWEQTKPHVSDVCICSYSAQMGRLQEVSHMNAGVLLKNLRTLSSLRLVSAVLHSSRFCALTRWRRADVWTFVLECRSWNLTQTAVDHPQQWICLCVQFLLSFLNVAGILMWGEKPRGLWQSRAGRRYFIFCGVDVDAGPSSRKT